MRMISAHTAGAARWLMASIPARGRVTVGLALAIAGTALGAGSPAALADCCMGGGSERADFHARAPSRGAVRLLPVTTIEVSSEASADYTARVNIQVGQRVLARVTRHGHSRVAHSCGRADVAVADGERSRGVHRARAVGPGVRAGRVRRSACASPRRRGAAELIRLTSRARVLADRQAGQPDSRTAYATRGASASLAGSVSAPNCGGTFIAASRSWVCDRRPTTSTSRGRVVHRSCHRQFSRFVPRLRPQDGERAP